MKKVIFMVVALPMFAMAHGNPVEATSGAVVEVLKQFNASETKETKSNFRGIKAWPSGAEIVAKVYVNQDNKEVALSYSCTMDHSGGHDALVCKKQ